MGLSRHGRIEFRAGRIRDNSRKRSGIRLCRSGTMSLISRNLITHSGIDQYTTSRNYKQDGYNDQYMCPGGEVSAGNERWPRLRHTFTSLYVSCWKVTITHPLPGEQ